MDEKRIKKVICIRAISPKIHPIPDEDSVFYRRGKPEINLNNSTTRYCRIKKYLFSHDNKKEK